MRWLLFVILSLPALAQREYTVWHFGQTAGVSFTSGIAVPVRGPFITWEGTASWCDPSTGELMFSTDGMSVYRRDGSVMPNGTGLQGGFSSTQSALIVPDPASPLQFYVFCAGDLSWNATGTAMLTVNTVDFASDPMGVVTRKNDTVVMGTAEKCTGTLHCNGRSYWVVTHHRDEPIFYAYNVTSAGISAPVISRVGQQYVVPPSARGGPYGQGMLKFSASGRKIAMASPFAQRCEVFDFDPATGVVSNVQLMGTGQYYYGLAFSPNEQLLYVTTWSFDPNVGGEVQQMSLDGTFAPQVVGTFQPSASITAGGIQRGPDGHIYLTDDGGLSLIEYPDAVGAACYFRSRVVYFVPPLQAHIGLANNMDCLYDRNAIVVCSAPISDFTHDTVICEGACVRVEDRSTQAPTTWTWSFVGGTPSMFAGQSPPDICYASEGTYPITLITSNAFGADTMTSMIRVAPSGQVDAGNDIVLCDSAYGRLQASGAVWYRWESEPSMQSTTVPDPIVRPFVTTTYVVHGFTADSCESVDSVTVFVRIDDREELRYRVDDVAAVAGDSIDVVLTRTGGIVSIPTTLRLLVPATSLHGVRIVDGVGTVSRPTVDTFAVDLTDDGTSYRVGSIRAMLLLSSTRDSIIIAGTPQTTCDTIIGQGASIVAQACAAELRIISTNGQPLTIERVDVGSRQVTVTGNPRTSVVVDVADLQGRQWCTVVATLDGGRQTLDLPCELPAIGLVRLRSGQMMVTATVISR